MEKFIAKKPGAIKRSGGVGGGGGTIIGCIMPIIPIATPPIRKWITSDPSRRAACTDDAKRIVYDRRLICHRLTSPSILRRFPWIDRISTIIADGAIHPVLTGQAILRR
jgi:hypothetical protein